MKIKFGKRDRDFNALKTKIFMRTVLMVIAAIFSVILLYSFILQGHFANAVVAVLQLLFRMDYESALLLYRRIFRNNAYWMFYLAMLITFFFLFRIYLNWFVRYFAEVIRGIDVLGKDDVEEVSLSPEMRAVEKKINAIRHTLQERKTAAQLAEQRKNDLIVYLAHDLKTPLASVIGYLNLLRDEREISEELQEKYLSIALTKAERLEELINEFFEIARFNLSNITLQYGTINLTRLLEQVVYEFEPMLKEKNLNCHLNTTDDMMINCDGDKMQRVFDNILRNALFYSYEGTDIGITAVSEENEKGGAVRVRFTNHGNTIPQDKLERIFEQFYRLDMSRSTNSGGAGLGLAIAKEIVERHNGTITAKSEDELTEFEVCLPIVRKS